MRVQASNEHLYAINLLLETLRGIELAEVNSGPVAGMVAKKCRNSIMEFVRQNQTFFTSSLQAGLVPGVGEAIGLNKNLFQLAAAKYNLQLTIADVDKIKLIEKQFCVYVQQEKADAEKAVNRQQAAQAHWTRTKDELLHKLSPMEDRFMELSNEVDRALRKHQQMGGDPAMETLDVKVAMAELEHLRPIMEDYQLDVSFVEQMLTLQDNDALALQWLRMNVDDVCTIAQTALFEKYNKISHEQHLLIADRLIRISKLFSVQIAAHDHRQEKGQDEDKALLESEDLIRDIHAVDYLQQYTHDKEGMDNLYRQSNVQLRLLKQALIKQFPKILAVYGFTYTPPALANGANSNTSSPLSPQQSQDVVYKTLRRQLGLQHTNELQVDDVENFESNLQRIAALRENVVTTIERLKQFYQQNPKLKVKKNKSSVANSHSEQVGLFQPAPVADSISARALNDLEGIISRQGQVDDISTFFYEDKVSQMTQNLVADHNEIINRLNELTGGRQNKAFLKGLLLDSTPETLGKRAGLAK